MAALKDICLLITDGKHGDCQNEDASGFYFISCKDVRDGLIDYSDARQITEADYLDTHRRTQLQANDIVITNSGTIGRMALVPDAPETSRTTFQKSVAILKPNPEKVIAEWLYYSLMANCESLIASAGGTAQKNLLLRDMRAFNVDVPPLPTQRKIASILSAYDDLIENNARRIKILEEMAQALYREWFVHFRFPGHEKVRMVDSPLGEIPEGWIVSNFMNIADVLSGGTPKTSVSEFWNGTIPFFTPKDATTSFYVIETEKSITEVGLRKCNSRLYAKDTVFITARGTVGKITMPAIDMAMNQSCYALNGKEGFGQYYIFLVIQDCIEKLKQKATGAVFDTIIDTFRKLDLAKPPKWIVDDFSILVKPIFDQILNFLFRNGILSSTRDMLLAKLISGELNIDGINIRIEAKDNDRSIS